MKEIIFINTTAEFEQAKNMNFILNKKVIALSYTIFYMLEKSNMDVVPIWEYAGYNEMLESLKRDLTIIEKFWFPFCDSINYSNYSRVALFPLIYFLDEALVSSLFINKIIESENPGKIFYFTSHIKKPCIEGEWQGNVFDAMLEYHCQKNNIKYEKIYRESEKKKFTKNKKSSKIQYILFYFFGLFLSLFLYPIFFLFKKKAAICLVSEKEKKTRLGWVYKKLHKHFKLFIINIFNNNTLKYINVYTGGFITKLMDNKKVREEYLNMCKKLFAYKKNFDLQLDILNNSFLTYQWEYLIGVFCETIYNARRKAKRINRLFHPQTIIISQAHQPRTIALSKAFQKLGVKSFILPHATLPYNFSYFYDFHDIILVTGRYQYQKMLEFGIKSEKFFAINDERYKIKERNNNLTSLYKKYNIDNKKIITIITRNTQAGASFFPKWDVRVSMEKTYKFLKVCASLSDLGFDYHIIFKSHPLRDYYELYDQFSKAQNIQHIRNEPVVELLQISHLVIFVGPITDVLFEAEVRKKNIIICNSGLDNVLIELLQKDITIVDEPRHLPDKVKIQMNNLYNNFPNTHIINEFLQVEQN